MYPVLYAMHFVLYNNSIDRNPAGRQHGLTGKEAILAVFMEKPNGDGWAHLISDRHGKAGRAELQGFLKRIGVGRPLHRGLTYAEHCDIRGPEIDRALQAGASVISRRRLALLLREKREGDAGISPGLPAGEP